MTGLTADAQKRLDAIESLEDLGAGFVLATHDLEIRGAGELLGEGQSGQIQEIGFSLYNEMLSKTVQALRDGLEPDLDIEMNAGTEVNLHVAALMPDDYLPDVHLRLVHYKRIASARDAHELDQLQVELIDRFGLLPEPTKNLFRITSHSSAHQPPSEYGGSNSAHPAGLVEFYASHHGRPRCPGSNAGIGTGQVHARSATKTQDQGEELDEPQQRFKFANQLVDMLSSTPE